MLRITEAFWSRLSYSFFSTSLSRFPFPHLFPSCVECMDSGVKKTVESFPQNHIKIMWDLSAHTPEIFTQLTMKIGVLVAYGLYSYKSKKKWYQLKKSICIFTGMGILSRTPTEDFGKSQSF